MAARWWPALAAGDIFDDPWSKPPPHCAWPDPKLGVLHPNLMRRVQAAWGAVQE